MNIKGMIFAGCSFTWGEGLELYSDLTTIPWNEINRQNLYHFPDLSYFMPKSHIKYIESNRFPRLVSSHFNTFDIVAEKNGGNIFTMQNHIEKSLIDFENDISHIIVQLTENYRGIKIHDNCFKECCSIDLVRMIEHYYSIKSNQDVHEYAKYYSDILQKSLGDVDNYKNYLNEKSLNKFVSFIEKLKSISDKGIKVHFIGSWHETQNLLEYNKEQNNDLYEFYSKNIIPIQYNNKSYNSLHEFFSNHEFLIVTDFPNTKNWHPSKKAHNIIADSVISFIENN